MSIGAAILAAGGSRRLGHPKQLLPFRGTTLLRAVAREVCAARCDRVAVVLGAHAGAVAPTIADLPIAPLSNVLWSEGIASSIRCAVAWAMQSALDALLLVVCDQPQLTAQHVDRLIAAHRATGRAVASRYSDVAGVPAIFGGADYPALCGLSGDIGARGLCAASAMIDWPEGAFDVDTPGLARALG